MPKNHFNDANKMAGPSLWPIACALLVGVLLASWVRPSRPSPWTPGPIPDPHIERPVIAAIVRFAKSVGWMLVFAEPPPPPAPAPEPTTVEAEPECEIGPDGYPVCRHERGW